MARSHFMTLNAGDYTLVTRLRGFAVVTNMIRLAAGRQMQRNIMLPLGEIQETVSVRDDGTGRRPANQGFAPRERFPSHGSQARAGRLADASRFRRKSST